VYFGVLIRCILGYLSGECGLSIVVYTRNPIPLKQYRKHSFKNSRMKVLGGAKIDLGLVVFQSTSNLFVIIVYTVSATLCKGYMLVHCLHLV